MFHRAFFNLIIDQTPTHALFIQHYISLVCVVTLVVQCVGLQRIVPQGSQRTPATCIAATTPELTVGILNSVF